MNLHGYFLLSAFCMLIFTRCSLFPPFDPDIDPDSTVTVHPVRSGLVHFFSKLRRGGDVKIAYLGGSITEAGNGWRDQSFNWLKSQYPAANLSQVNAGVGGTGSDLGVFRLRKDVLVQEPDLVFVEFAVNDNGRPTESVHKSIEGIVRQIWKANRRTDICFVYTITENTAPALLNGGLTNTMEAMEDVASHYGIPTVHMSDSVIRLYKAGSLVFKGRPQDYPGKIVFSSDGTHPYSETGHMLYAATLAKALESFSKATFPPRNRLVRPLDPDNWEYAQMIAANELIYSGNWTTVTSADTILPDHLLTRFPSLIRGDQQVPAPSVSFRYRGSVVGLYDIVGPGTGQLEIYVDGVFLDRKTRFDMYSTYYRPQYFYRRDIPEGSHTIEFRISDRRFDKGAILAQGNNQITDSARYASYSCYMGYLLLVGRRSVKD